jgi:hypothetical protein
MLDWYLSLQHANWKHRLWAALFLGAMLFNLGNGWSNLHSDLAIARWIAWSMVLGVVLFAPGCLLVLLAGRVPRSFARIPGSLKKTLPEINAEIRRGHEERERNSRRF